MGLLFQPRWTGHRRPASAPPRPEEVAPDRGLVLAAALEAVIIGDGSRFAELFTDDVAFTSPHVVVRSLARVHEALGSPEDALQDHEITITSLDALHDKVVAEWRLSALFTRPVLFDDRLLVEPTGERVGMPGISVAEFRDRRICALRSYFDDTELLVGAPGVPTHLRWDRGP